MLMKPDLRVLVTAGAAGIGRAIADALIREGARVHVCDVAEDALAEFRTTHPGGGASLADVADSAAVDRMFGEVEDRLRGLDVLVNNAGIAGPTAAVEDIAVEDWRRTIAVNLDGQFHCLRRAVPLLKAAGDGAILAISSVAGRLGYPYRLPYAASKWAIVGMTHSLAKELGPHGIRVNAILPGVVEGPRIERVIAARAAATGASLEAMRQEYRDKASLRRMVSAEDIAAMAVFLCSAAARNVSGQAISVDANVETL